jgi:hypothetical protein
MWMTPVTPAYDLLGQAGAGTNRGFRGQVVVQVPLTRPFAESKIHSQMAMLRIKQLIKLKDLQ